MTTNPMPRVTILQCDPQRPYVILNSGQAVLLAREVLARFPWMMKYTPSGQAHNHWMNYLENRL
jgi:hypothetical protein